MTPLHAESIPIVYSNPSSIPENNWYKVYDQLPSYYSVRPVWDGSHLYYATLCHRDGIDVWVVVERLQFNHHSENPIKVGEIVYPTHWMEIFPPLT